MAELDSSHQAHGAIPVTASAKWLQLTIDILGYELQHTGDGQLLSEAADRWIVRHPVAARLFIVIFGLLLIAHLANLLHDDYDIVSRNFWRRDRAWRQISAKNAIIVPARTRAPQDWNEQ